MSKLKKQLNIIFSGVGDHTPEKLLAKELHKYNAVSDKVDFGILYNALTYKKNGNEFGESEAYKDIVLMADSGGFQIISGKIKNGSEEDKYGVYINQAKNADYGFCFDVEPTTSGFYDHTKALEKTLETNNNIKRQIEVFKELNSRCLIFPIPKVQPDDREISYENLLKDCDLNLIAGLAANTEIFNEFFAFPFFFKEFRDKARLPNVLHHLGVGTPSKILPFYLLAQLDFFGKDFIYSIDSTSYSHSLSLHSAICLPNGKIVKMRSITNQEFNEWKNYCIENFPELCVGKKEFHNINRHQTLSVKGGLDELFTFMSLSYAMKMLLKMVEDPWNFAANNNILTYQQLQSIIELAKCSDWKDYYEWKAIFNKVWVKFNLLKVKPLERSRLDKFF